MSSQLTVDSKKHLRWQAIANQTVRIDQNTPKHVEMDSEKP